MKIFVALFAALVMFGAMGAGSVLAHENGAFADAAECPALDEVGGPECLAAASPYWAPVGRNALLGDNDTTPFDHPGLFLGFDPSVPTPAVVGITNNPLCPRHWHTEINPDH